MTAPGPWRSYTASVQWKRGNPASAAAKAAVQRALCARFRIAPCAVAPTSPPAALHFARDLDLIVPAALFTDVTFFLMQYSSGVVHGAGPDLDVMLYPNTNCPELDVPQHAVHIGHKTPFNTNLLPPAAAALAPALEVEPAGSRSAALAETNSSMFYSCSSDATCYPPFAPNTGCTGDAQQTAAHFHFYYVGSDPAMLSAVLRFVRSIESTFGISHTVCPDNFGHEQPHNHSCWLEGPGGGGDLPPPSNATPPGGSFVYPAFALYVVRKDFTKVLSHVMLWKNADHIGTNLDFMSEPPSRVQLSLIFCFGLPCGLMRKCWRQVTRAPAATTPTTCLGRCMPRTISSVS